MVTVWRSAAHLTHYSFLNPRETITSEKYAQQNWWDALKTTMPTTSTSQQKGPNSPWQHPTMCSTTNTSQVAGIGLQSFASSTIFTWPLTNWPALLQASWQLFFFFLTTFCRENASTGAGGRKCFPRICQILKHGFLCYRNKLISYWQKHVDCNGSYFD